MRFTHEQEFTIGARREQVFEALTDETALRGWFAEAVEVEPREGGLFRFSGRGAYKGGGEGRITAFEVGRRLAISYDFDGIPCDLDLRLEDGEGSATKLRLRQEFERTPPGERIKHLLEDLWRLHIVNLMSWFGQRHAILLPDFDDPAPKVELSIHIDAPPAVVFDALTDPEMLKVVFGAPDPVVEPRVGGAYRFGWSYEVEGRKVIGGPTKILEITPGERLVTDWPDWRGDPDIPVQRVAWTLAPEGQGTRLSLVHDGFVRTVDMGDYPGGWGFFLGQLKTTAEKAAVPLEPA